MADRGRVLGTLRLIAPTIEDEWHHADILIAELKEWDVRQSEALGFDGNEVTSVFTRAIFETFGVTACRPRGVCCLR
jgi:hypothetical protein